MTRRHRELALELDAALGRRAGLEQALRTAIQDGRLRRGDLLPSTRSLAEQLGLSRATVVAAFDQLVAEGFLVAEQGRATRVLHDGAIRSEPMADNPVGRRTRYDFRPGQPDLSAFPRREWGRSLRRTLDVATDDMFGLPDPRGCSELRRALADHLRRTRAVAAEPAALMVFGGFTSALGFLGECLARGGRTRVAVEDPMLFLHRDVLGLAGIECVPIPVDEHGLRTDLLDDVEADAVLVCPAHQYPTCVALSASRRTTLIEWAERVDAWVIEDDYDAEFRYDRRPVGALQGLAPHRVVHAGTTSKTLAPGLRLSWLTVPATLRDDLASTLHLRAGVSIVDQLALADFIDRGCLDTHVRSMRQRYRLRREAIAARLGDFDWIEVPEVAAGLHVLARFVGAASAVDEGTVVRRLAELSVGVVGLGRHWATSTTPPFRGIVIGFAAPSQHQFDAALDALAEGLEAVSGTL